MNAFFEEAQKFRYYPLILSLSAGVLLAVSWYKPFTMLIFVALAPLVALERYIADTPGARRYPTLSFFGYAFLSMLLWNVGAIWWLWNASGWATLAAWGANAALQSLPLVLFQVGKRWSANRFGSLLLVSCWMAFEWVHLHWDLSWIWLQLGHAFANYPWWIQWYEYTGVFGGTLWILTANVLAYHFIYHNRHKVRLGAVAIIPITISQLIGYFYEEKGTSIEVAVVQPNLDPYTEKFDYNAKTGQHNPHSMPYDQQVKRFLELSLTAVKASTKFLVFPETSLHGSKDEAKLSDMADVSQVAAFVRQRKGLSLVTGIDTYKLLSGPEASETARFEPGFGYYDLYNAAYFVGDTGQTAVYRKSQLVIGAETMPWPSLLGPLILNFGGASGSMGRQKERSVFFNSEGTGVAPVICYESVYGEFVTEYVQKGASLLFIITNDGWWGDTPGHRQHLAYASLRAIETRRSIARAANTGISAFINQRGEIVESIPYKAMGSLPYKLKANTEQTFYVRMGDYLGRLAAALAVFMLISALALHLRRKKS